MQVPIGWIKRTPWLVGLPREVAVLSAIAFCVALGFGIVVPAIPIFAVSFGVSALAAGAVVSAFALMRFVSSPPAGMVLNRVGERLVLTSGLLVVAVSSLLAGMSGDFGHLLVMRGLGGVGSAMFTVSAMALLMRTTDPERRGRASSAFQAGFLFGGVAGPAVGGLALGFSLRAPFFTYAGTLAVAAAVSWLGLRPGRRNMASHGTDARSVGDQRAQSADEGRGLRETPSALGSALRRSPYRAALMANLNTGLTTFGIRASLVPMFVVGALHEGPAWAGVGFVVGALLQAGALVPAGRLTDSRGRRPTMIIGASATAVGMAGLAASSGLGIFLGSMAILGIGAACLGSAPTAIVGDVMGEHRGGTVVAAFQMVSDVGAVVGPLMAGMVVDSVGYAPAFAIGFATSVALLVMALRMPETIHA